MQKLDPTDWAAVRRLGRRMVDDMLDYQETVRERPPWLALGAELMERGRLGVAVSGA